jgi:hypothetical protein
MREAITKNTNGGAFMIRRTKKRKKPRWSDGAFRTKGVGVGAWKPKNDSCEREFDPHMLIVDP